MKISSFITPLVRRKLATLVLLSASVAAFATLGEGNKTELPRSNKNLLTARSATVNYKNFSLRSGYSYRGSQVLNNKPSANYIILNSTVTVEKGNQTYIVPMKRKVLLDRVNFRPSAIR